MPVTLTCQHCGKSFQIPPSMVNGTHGPRKYCSNDCKYAAIEITERAEYVDTDCLTCGKPLRILKSRWDDGRGRYCSQKCMMKQRPPSRPKNLIKQICEYCGQEFEAYPCWIKKGEGKFCSKECAHKGRVMPKRAERTVRHCLQCGKELRLTPSEIKRPNNGRFCSRPCAAAYQQRNYFIESPTSIEQLLMNELNRRGVTHEFQYPYYQLTMDFAFPDVRLCVEADGDYWHNRPDNIERDRRRDWMLFRRGWLTLRFTETEILASVQQCVDKIEQVLFDLRFDPGHFTLDHPDQ